MKKYFLVVASLIITLAASLFLKIKLAQAASEFRTAFTSTYTINESGNTHIIHQIDITNNLTHIYTTKYTLAVGSDRLKNIQTSISGVPVLSSIDQNGSSTTVTVEFPVPVIGKDQVTKLQISYDSPDIATILGDTLTINIPRMSKANEAESFTRIVQVPLTMPSLSSLTPKDHGEQQDDKYRTYTFTGHGNESITMLFGEHVTYKVNLAYEISNPKVNAENTEIALPPDTAYQQVLLNLLTPPPLSIRLDSDGNWLALYLLKPQEKKVIQAELYVTVSAIPSFYDPSAHGKNLTESRNYWDSHNPQIIDLGKQLKTPKNIYTYLVDNFSYNYARVKVGTDRLGAVNALENPQNALCTEFTDTFIALARSQNILSREINGFAYSDNLLLRPLGLETDILHSWPEYYDEGSASWISVDPTWANTTGGVDYFSKMDFNHLTFVRHGAESNYPLPAGVYKTTAKTKQIEVQVAAAPERVESSLKTGEFIKNTGNVALIGGEFGYLPPYGEYRQSIPSLNPLTPKSLYLLVGLALSTLIAVFLLFLVKRKK